MSVSTSDGAALPTSSSPDPFQEERTIVILVGLIASGKSTFAEALEKYFPRFCRCNQDDLGNRHRVEELAYNTLCEGRSPCIDRTNFNAIQRSYWSVIARSFPGTSISVIVFDTPYHICASRLQRRTSHPTIRDAQHGMAVLQKFASDFEMPSPDEGYDHIIYLRPSDHPHQEYTRDDILAILERLKISTRDGTTSGIRSQPYYPGSDGRNRSRISRARGYRGGSFRGFSSARGTLYGSVRPTSRAGSFDNYGRGTSTSVETNQERPYYQRSATTNLPPMESSREGLGGGTP